VNRFKELRIREGLTQQNVADVFKVYQTAVVMWETRDNLPIATILSNSLNSITAPLTNCCQKPPQAKPLFDSKRGKSWHLLDIEMYLKFMVNTLSNELC